MSEVDYGISYIASAPEELKVGDRVEVIDKEQQKFRHIGRVYRLKVPLAHVRFENDINKYVYLISALRKLPDPIAFEEESDNVIVFNAILCEMGETYKAKNETYGDSYRDGFNRFGAVQLVSRMYEKYCRIENLLVHNADNKVPDESVIDTLTDLGVQCVALRMLLQKNDFKNVK